MKDMPFRYVISCTDGRATGGMAPSYEYAMDALVHAATGYKEGGAPLKRWTIHKGTELVFSHDEKPEDAKAFVTVTRGMSGWFAVMYWWNPEGFWEPWDTGVGRYDELELAVTEAQNWAKAENIEYVARDKKAPVRN